MTDRIIAIGEVHGSSKALATLLEAIQPTQRRPHWNKSNSSGRMPNVSHQNPGGLLRYLRHSRRPSFKLRSRISRSRCSQPHPVQRRPAQVGPLQLCAGRGVIRTHGLDARRPALPPREAKLTLGDDIVEARPGTWVHMPAGLRHSIQAKTPVVMLLLVLK
jgi:hypothetical protein